MVEHFTFLVIPTILGLLFIHSTHAAANLDSRYSKYTKVARVHHFCTIALRNISRSADASVGLIYGRVGLIYFLKAKAIYTIDPNTKSQSCIHDCRPNPNPNPNPNPKPTCIEYTVNYIKSTV